MPTAGRPEYAEEAVEMFRRQTWPRRELVILDDADRPSLDGFQKCQYGEGWSITRIVEKPLGGLGTKRNRVNSFAMGSIVCHWDDDDIYSDDRVEHQARRLLASEKQIVGYCPLLFWTEATGKLWRYTASRPGDAPGGTLMYYLHFWLRQNPMKDRPERFGTDTIWIRSNRIFIDACDGERRYIARNHPAGINGRCDASIEKDIAGGCDQWEFLGVDKSCRRALTVSA